MSNNRTSLSMVERTDLRVTRIVGINQNGDAARWLARFADLGDQPPMIGLAVLTIAAGLLRRDERLARTGLRMLAAHSIATMGKLAVKDTVDRTRPGALNEKAYCLEQGTSRDGRLRSMPSGHSAGVMAIAGAIGPYYPGAILPAAAAATSIAGAQLPSKNHFLSDVLVGAGIGLAAAAIARLLIPPIEKLGGRTAPLTRSEL